jgi:hypothetical protein
MDGAIPLFMSTIRIPRRNQENKERPPVAQDQDKTGIPQPDIRAGPQETRAERAEEAEFATAREHEELPEHYRTRIDKY